MNNTKYFILTSLKVSENINLIYNADSHSHTLVINITMVHIIYVILQLNLFS